MVMPRNSMALTADEMTYVEGGGAFYNYGTAKSLKTLAAAAMSGWLINAGGGGAVAAASAMTGVGLPVTLIAGATAAYSLFLVEQYRQAYVYFNNLSQTSSTRYYMRHETLLGMIAGVTYGRA
jgi:hypothetical protein